MKPLCVSVDRGKIDSRHSTHCTKVAVVAKLSPSGQDMAGPERPLFVFAALYVLGCCCKSRGSVRFLFQKIGEEIVSSALL